MQRRHRAAIEDSSRRVAALIHLRTEHLGPDELLVAAKLEFRHDLSIRELADVVDGSRPRCRAAFPPVGPIYIEPDITRVDQLTGHPPEATPGDAP